jgi:hypothetical protein
MLAAAQKRIADDVYEGEAERKRREKERAMEEARLEAERRYRMHRTVLYSPSRKPGQGTTLRFAASRTVSTVDESGDSVEPRSGSTSAFPWEDVGAASPVRVGARAGAGADNRAASSRLTDLAMASFSDDGEASVFHLLAGKTAGITHGPTGNMLTVTDAAMKARGLSEDADGDDAFV